MLTNTTGTGLLIWRFIKRLFLILFFLQLFYILLLKWVNPPITITQMVSWLTGQGLKRDYVSIKRMSLYPKLAVIAAEDQLFPDHKGFDWQSIQKARKHNEKNPRKIKGASTISQQVAKNVFFVAGEKLDKKGAGSILYIYDRISLGKKENIGNVPERIGNGKGNFRY